MFCEERVLGFDLKTGFPLMLDVFTGIRAQIHSCGKWKIYPSVISHHFTETREQLFGEPETLRRDCVPALPPSYCNSNQEDQHRAPLYSCCGLLF